MSDHFLEFVSFSETSDKLLDGLRSSTAPMARPNQRREHSFALLDDAGSPWPRVGLCHKCSQPFLGALLMRSPVCCSVCDFVACQECAAEQVCVCVCVFMRVRVRLCVQCLFPKESGPE